ncbi:MAG TPA: sensor histidine kinase [Rhizomicrobium sp.]|jgi:signal transduction histidine kinase|nr:sensor histidine kinase [Rhizomicrobium sp.]
MVSYRHAAHHAFGSGANPNMRTWTRFVEHQPRGVVAAGCIILVLVTGFVDYLTGTLVSFSAFYLLPVSLAAWFVGSAFGLFIAALCVAVWLPGNLLAGDPNFANPFLIAWNASIQLTSFCVVVFVVGKLHNLTRDLERRVRERAAALTKEIAERERLQNLLLQASEKEQRRIGQELHDGLGQHLAGTAIAGQVLHEKLERRSLEEARDAAKVVQLIEEGVVLTRRSAKGLYPVDMQAEGLMLALEEFALTTTRLFDVHCRFLCESPVLVDSAVAAEHLFRIAQEATRNAIQHGGARNIDIELNTLEEGHELRIADDGRGLPAALPANGGLGLRIMEQRAQTIGAHFQVTAGPEGGTIVICRLPVTIDERMAS